MCDILVYFILQHGLKNFFGENASDYEINIFTEQYKIKKTGGSIVFAMLCCILQYHLSLGFEPASWFAFYVYDGYFMYRAISYADQ